MAAGCLAFDDMVLSSGTVKTVLLGVLSNHWRNIYLVVTLRPIFDIPVGRVRMVKYTYARTNHSSQNGNRLSRNICMCICVYVCVCMHLLKLIGSSITPQ